MTLSPTLVAVLVSLSLREDGSLDEAASTEAFMKVAHERVQLEQKNTKEILAFCEKNAGERVTTESVVSRLITNREREVTRQRLLNAEDGEEVEDFEFSPAKRTEVKESIEATIESLKASGKLVAKAGRGGGIQTAAIDAALTHAAKKGAKLVTESKGQS